MEVMMKYAVMVGTLVLLASCAEKAVFNTAVETAEPRIKWGKPGKNLQCSLACSAIAATPQAPAKLELRVRNVGDSVARYHIDSCCGPTYSIIAVQADGKTLTFHDLVQEEHFPCGVKNWISLVPREVKKHQIPIRLGDFLGEAYLFVGELGAPIKTYGETSITVKAMGTDSNALKLIVKPSEPGQAEKGPESLRHVSQTLMDGIENKPLTPAKVSALVEFAASSETPETMRFDAVRTLAISPYTKESAAALTHVACEKDASETCRNYAAMGLRNFSNQLPKESRSDITKRLRRVLEDEKSDSPDSIVRTLLAWGSASFVKKTLGGQLNGHDMEIEVLAALPGDQSRARLWQLYQNARKGYKASVYKRKADIGIALVGMDDVRGIDVLVDLLPKAHAPSGQHRHNLFKYLSLKIGKNFGYSAVNYDPALEDAVPAMISWWETNRKTFSFHPAAGRK